MIQARDRGTVLVLFGAAILSWLGLAIVLLTVYPDALEVRLFVAAALGTAVALTATPFAWLAAFGGRGRRTRPGDWARAGRRGILAGALVALVAALRVTATTSIAIVVFAIVLAVFVEVMLSYRR